MRRQIIAEDPSATPDRHAGPTAVLTIGDLASRTGVAAGTLRTWESRYGVPSPGRSKSGQRRYSSDDVVLVEETLRHRASGLSMSAAVERARAGTQDRSRPNDSSVYAGLLRRHPDLRVHLLRKPAVLALCRAVEDECAAQADRPLLFAAFQRTELYEPSRRRWAELSRTALETVVFADFTPGPRSARRPGTPLEVPVPFDSPLNREWVLVCDSAEHPGCVVGWERPGEPDGEDRSRRFETLWTVDPQVVRDAARLCAQLSETHLPGHTYARWAELDSTPERASAQTRRAEGVLDRVLEYLAAATDRA